MKLKFFFATLFVLISVTSFGQSKVERIGVKASIYCNHCNRCESCGKRLKEAVFTEKGIKRVDVDEKTKTVNVVYIPQKTTPEQIRQAISNVGFDADDLKGNPEAYKKLDDCCQKQEDGASN